MGVRINRYGKPLSYFVWDRHPSGVSRGERREIAAADVLHVYKRIRPSQTRGITWFAPALVTWKLGDQYTESELVQSMLAAAQGGFFVNREGTGNFPTRTVTDPATGEKLTVPIEIEAQPGVGQVLPGGWEFQTWSPTHPTANYVGFMKAVKRLIGRAFGRSYASLTGDLSDVNYSSMRTDRVREIEQNKLHQEDLLVRQFSDVIYADWLYTADVSNALGVLAQSHDEILSSSSWMCRGWPWVDPLKDAATAQMEIQMRINSPQRVCAERGRDFYDIVDEIADAEAYAVSKGLTMGSVDLAVALSSEPQDEEKDAPQSDRAPSGRVTPLRISA
jgi:lambda family phage portal protein